MANQNGGDVESFNPTTGVHTIISGAGVGTGPAFSTAGNSVTNVEFLLNGALVVEDGNNSLFSVDPLTGNRTQIAGTSVGTGPAYGGIVFQIGVEATGTVLAGGLNGRQLIRIDPTTLNRTIVSDATHGTGATYFALTSGIAVVPQVPEPSTIVLAALGVLAIFACRRRSVKIAAAAAVLFAAPLSTHAQLPPGDLVVGVQFSTSDSGLMIVDPTTGNRTILSDNTHGTGPAWSEPAGISFASDRSLLVGDDASNAILRVDPTTGNRTIIASNTVGTGGEVGLSAEQFGASILASGGGGLLSIDPTTGNRTVVSGPSVGSGPSLGGWGIAISGTNVITGGYTGTENVLLSVDTTTGNRTTISGDGVGSGPSIAGDTLLDVESDNHGNFLVSILLGGPLFRIDPTTGNRTIVSGSGVGTGPVLGPFIQIGVASGGSLFATGGAPSFEPQIQVLQIDPLTGNRTVVSDATHGTGPAFNSLTGGLAVVPSVPEPSTILLVALGLLMLALRGLSRSGMLRRVA